MRKLALIVSFVLTCAAQLAYAGSSVVRHERALREGIVYRFETAAIDPLDPFRGRYVQLRLPAAEVDLPLSPAVLARCNSSDARVYAVLGRDARGFATFTALSTTPPEQGDYVETRASCGRTTSLSLPDRFYVEEDRAPVVERLYRERAARGQPAVVVMRVREGLAVIESLELDSP